MFSIVLSGKELFFNVSLFLFFRNSLRRMVPLFLFWGVSTGADHLNYLPRLDFNGEKAQIFYLTAHFAAEIWRFNHVRYNCAHPIQYILVARNIFWSSVPSSLIIETMCNVQYAETYFPPRWCFGINRCFPPHSVWGVMQRFTVGSNLLRPYEVRLCFKQPTSGCSIWWGEESGCWWMEFTDWVWRLEYKQSSD